MKYLIKAVAKKIVLVVPPQQVLKLLFRLDNWLYDRQSRLAVMYGGGTHTKHRHMRYHDFFVDRIQAGERVLDIGCGIGAVAYDVAERSQARVVGIDLESRAVVQAKQLYNHPHVTYCIGNALNGFFASRFDVVILSNVLEHLPGRPAFLQEVQQAIKPGRILIRVPLFERDWRVPLKRELGIEWRLDLTHETEYTLESFATEMAEASLEIIHLEVRWGEIWAETRSILTS